MSRRYGDDVFRSRATTRRSDEELDKPLRLVSVPAAVGLLLALLIVFGGALWLFGGQVAVRVAATGVIVNPPENVSVVTAVGGVIVSGPPTEGQEVKKGEAIAAVRTPDGAVVPVPSPIDGVVVAEGSAPDAPVTPGQVLATVAHEAVPMVGIVFAPTNTIPGIAVGDPVSVQPMSADPSTEGVLNGTVSSITRLPVSAERVESLVTDPALAAEIMTEGTVHEIMLTLETLPDQPDQLVWTGGPGPSVPPASGEIVGAEIIIAEQSPWQSLVSGN